ncbi:MAG: phosphonate C-P lyase system protein PhnH [Hyphomicrobiaceae bacterium]|jgi:alpha-D-ribose 1-methylphosphonate 5-triphosphate synthase subunit PhnH
MQDSPSIGRAFASPTLDAQSTFRTILDAFARPGRVLSVSAPCEAPDGLPAAAAAALLTLVDYETPVWMPASLDESARRWLTFHTSAPAADTPMAAKFAVIDGAAANPALGDFDPGEDRYPDKSATLIVLCASLSGGPEVVLTGPGIKDRAVIAPAGLAASFWRDWSANHDRFPLGVDVLLVAGDTLVALPRSTAARPLGGA